MILQSNRIFIDGKFIKGQIEIEDNIITNIYEDYKYQVDYDFSNYLIIPGFYDIHTHGYKGFDTNDANKEGLKIWLKEIVKEGVCGICPTTITHCKDVLTKALKNINEVSKEDYEGAKILGIHFEGPYLNKKYKGAQNEDYIVCANKEEIDHYYDVSSGLIKIITLAPEIEDNFKIIKYCKEKNINVSIGHSDATYEIALKAINEGAKAFTHTYNAMRPFNHREVGLVGASLLIDDAYSEIICDTYHVNIEALKLFFKIKPIDKIIMISDSLMAKGLDINTKHIFGGQEIIIKEDGTCHLTENDALAGSTLRINKALQILVEKVGLDFKDAIKTCTINPMKYLNIDNIGLIKENYIANITIIDDNYEVINTIVNGKIY